MQEALSFEGETGPYVQYAAVRARNILRKLEERGEQLPDFAAELEPDGDGAATRSSKISGRCCWRPRRPIRRWRARSLPASPRTWRRYAFQLAQAFSNFYQKYPIIHEEDREKKVFLLWMTDFFRRQLERTRVILGIQIPEYM